MSSLDPVLASTSLLVVEIYTKRLKTPPSSASFLCFLSPVEQPGFPVSFCWSLMCLGFASGVCRLSLVTSRSVCSCSGLRLGCCCHSFTFILINLASFQFPCACLLVPIPLWRLGEPTTHHSYHTGFLWDGFCVHHHCCFRGPAAFCHLFYFLFLFFPYGFASNKILPVESGNHRIPEWFGFKAYPVPWARAACPGPGCCRFCSAWSWLGPPALWAVPAASAALSFLPQAVRAWGQAWLLCLLPAASLRVQDLQTELESV